MKIIDVNKLHRMREITGQFISASDCNHALALSNGVIYDAIMLLHNKKIKNFSKELKLSCCKPRWNSKCSINTTCFFYEKNFYTGRYETVPYCKVCIKSVIENIKYNHQKSGVDVDCMIISIDEFKRLMDGEPIEKVCPRILVSQVIDS